MGDNSQLSFPEDDEDLEALRLAALQSLKKKVINETSTALPFPNNKDRLNHFNGSPRGKQKRGKFTRTSQGRTPRNGQFNGWSRNSNLIAVPMVTDDPESCNKKKIEEDIPKLILPQDRYHKKEKTPEKSDAISKFDRYEKSDESDSESDDDHEKLDEEKPELKRSNSLEVLMAELENEIQGVSSKEDKTKNKPKKKRKLSVTTAESETKTESKPINVLKENLKPESEPAKKFQNFKQRKWQQKPRRHNSTNYISPNIVHQVIPPPEIIPSIVAFAPPPLTFPTYNSLGFDNGVFAPPPVVFEAPPPQLPPLQVAPPLYERPLSPLAINTDNFTTPTLAPLSPRSAAFVMENRAIIEKRKRRSFSRSPSPRFRRSKTPKRSLSPKRASISPKRRSLSPSPIRKVIPPRVNSPKKPPIHDRLGLKCKTDNDDDKHKKKEENLDPILEARRKKFERNEITMKEGVIRLKKSEDFEEKKDEPDVIDEDALLEGEIDDTILLDHKVDALFSDEESDSDNEGRFKMKQETNQKIPVLPYTKLINGVKSDIKTDLKLEEAKNNKARINRKRYRSRSPKNPSKKVVKTPKKNEKIKQTIGIGNDRKIEIKIRNPAKYEKVEAKIEEEKKIESGKKDEKESSENEEVATSNINDGDLRAQLSRKRAERQKHPLPDVVPSRLLQNALQGVGFRKGKKSKTDDDNLVEGKLPIHLRLGAANSSDFGKKSRKHKKGSQEQV